MTDLEHVRLTHGIDYSRLCRFPDVAREQGRETLVADPQNERVLVRLKLTVNPLAGRVQHLERHRIHRHDIAGSTSPPFGTDPVEFLQVLEVQYGTQRLAGIQHEFWC